MMTDASSKMADSSQYKDIKKATLKKGQGYLWTDPQWPKDGNPNTLLPGHVDEDGVEWKRPVVGDVIAILLGYFNHFVNILLIYSCF